MTLFDQVANATHNNATATMYALVRGLNAKVTRATVANELPLHPDFPSLLSLSEVLTEWNIDNTALQLNTVEQLRELPLPFIAHLRKNSGWYVLVTKIVGDRITYSDSADGNQTESLADFEKGWSGVVLLAECRPAEADEQSGERDYDKKRPAEIRENLRGPFVLASALLLTGFGVLSVATYLTVPDWLLLLTKSAGLLLSGLLVAKQLGNKNALTERLCRINSKTNCDGVLDSPGAKLWGWLSWADVGLLYFAGGLLTVLLISLRADVRPLLYGLALLALPYTIYSVYYQARVVRQWCTLCLAVQGVLLTEGGLAVSQLTRLPDFRHPYVVMLVAFLLPTLAGVLIKPLITNRIRSRREHDELLRFKRNPDVFRTLLLQQPMMSPVYDDLHPIIMGNPYAEHTITMVTNPYCGPCAKVHTELEQLLSQNQNVKAQIIFLACDGKVGKVHEVARHLLALHAEQPNTSFLFNWYSDEQKDYQNWAHSNAAVQDVTLFDAAVIKHCAWCQYTNVEGTPTLFVNGYALPDLYNLNSLSWLVNYLPTQSFKQDLARSI